LVFEMGAQEKFEASLKEKVDSVNTHIKNNAF
jgi:hypothetical protein